MVTIEVNQQQVDDVLQLLGGIQRDANKALSRSLNRTLIGARTLTAKELGATTTLKAARIKQDMVKKNATVDKLSAVLTLKSSLIPAINFTNRQLRRGVSVKKWKAKPPQKFSHAFYANIGGRRGIFMRAEISPNMYAGRIPTIELYGPPITTIYEKTPGLSDKVETESADRLLREMDSQVNFILSQRNA